jgi:peptidoglycan/LPS O-acetylase OafA/YrhL
MKVSNQTSGMKSIYFENLDGLRFLCFLSVFLFHFFTLDYPDFKDNKLFNFIAKDIFRNGNLGVNFFFVLSGFLITYLLIGEKIINGQIGVKFFWIRRILRIWPLFFICVLFGFAVFPVLKQMFGKVINDKPDLFYYLTFTNNFDFLNKGIPYNTMLSVLWSVAVEEQFYLIWPIIIYIFPLKKLWIPFAVLLITSLVFRSKNVSQLAHEIHTLSCIGDLSIGAFGAWLIIFFTNFKTAIENISKVNILFIYLSFILLYLLKDELKNLNHIFSIFERLIISIVILFIILEQSFAVNSYFKINNFKTITNLGKISYGLYCLHCIGLFIANVIVKRLHLNNHIWLYLLVELLLALIISIVFSQLSFKYFESYFLRLKTKFSTF